MIILFIQLHGEQVISFLKHLVVVIGYRMQNCPFSGWIYKLPWISNPPQLQWLFVKSGRKINC